MVPRASVVLTSDFHPNVEVAKMSIKKRMGMVVVAGVLLLIPFSLTPSEDGLYPLVRVNDACADPGTTPGGCEPAPFEVCVDIRWFYHMDHHKCGQWSEWCM